MCDCLDSALNQTYSDFELLLVDDGSTDNSGKICDDYARKDNRVRVFHKENGGVSSARNFGIDNAQGYQIMFIDSDDTVDSKYIENLMITDDEDMVQGDCSVLENGFLHPIMTHDDIISDFGRYWIESGSFSCCWKCFKSSFISKNKLRFDENHSLGEDERFIICCLGKVKKLRRTPACGYHYNTDVSSSAVKKTRLNRCHIEQDFCERIEQFDNKSSFVYPYRWYRWHCAFNHLYHHFNVQNDKTIKKKIKKSIIDSYKCSFFRMSIPYIRKNGSLDEKLESHLMGYYRHKCFKPILNIIQFLSKIKNKFGK